MKSRSIYLATMTSVCISVRCMCHCVSMSRCASLLIIHINYQLLPVRTLQLERIHQVTNTIHIANIGWRIRICFREYTFFLEAINFIRLCSKLFHPH